MTRLVQIQNGATRAVALVEATRLRLLADVKSIYELAHAAVTSKASLTALIQQKAAGEFLDYDFRRLITQLNRRAASCPAPA